MRRQHGPDIEPVDRIRHIFRRVTIAPKLAHCPSGRGDLRGRALILLVRTRSTNTVHLLGSIDEEKEKRESARGERGKFDRQRRDLGEQCRDAFRVRILASARAAGLAKILHCVKCVLPLEPPDYAPEHCRKPADIFVKRNVFGARRRIYRNYRARLNRFGGFRMESHDPARRTKYALSGSI